MKWEKKENIKKKKKKKKKKDKITCTKIMPRRTQNMVQQFTLAITET